MTLIAKAAEFLRTQLNRGPMLATDVQRACTKAGFSRATVLRAKRKAGVVSRLRQPSSGYPQSGAAGFRWEWLRADRIENGSNEYLVMGSITYGDSLAEQFLRDRAYQGAAAWLRRGV